MVSLVKNRYKKPSHFPEQIFPPISRHLFGMPRFPFAPPPATLVWHVSALCEQAMLPSLPIFRVQTAAPTYVGAFILISAHRPLDEGSTCDVACWLFRRLRRQSAVDNLQQIRLKASPQKLIRGVALESFCYGLLFLHPTLEDNASHFPDTPFSRKNSPQKVGAQPCSNEHRQICAISLGS